jgi:hypothetical protein
MNSITAPASTAPGRVLLTTAEPDAAPLVGSPDRAWRTAGWFGMLLTIVALTDMLLVLYPLRVGQPEWEFGVVDLTFSNLPLLSIGLAAMLGSALARGSRWQIRTMAAALILLTLVLVSAYALFLLNVPLALKAAPPPVLPGVKKAILKTSVFAVVFASAYLISGIAALRFVTSNTRRGND